MSTQDPPVFLAWRNNPVMRILGAAVSWFLFALSFMLLYQSSVSVLALGGFCASGGPYVIAVECPPAVAAFTPLSVFGGLIAVALGIFFARGFGMPLTTWAWPILFCGLGAGFLTSFFTTGDPTGLIIGIMFEIMGVVPLIIELRGSVQRVFLGQFDQNGVQLYEGQRARRSLLSPNTPNPEDAPSPTPLNWVLGLGIPLVAAFAGYQLAVTWFTSLLPR